MKQTGCSCTDLDHLLPAYWWECQMELDQKHYWWMDCICCFPFSAWLATLSKMKIKWLGPISSSHRHYLLLRALFLPHYWNSLFVYFLVKAKVFLSKHYKTATTTAVTANATISTGTAPRYHLSKTHIIMVYLLGTSSCLYFATNLWCICNYTNHSGS